MSALATTLTLLHARLPHILPLAAGLLQDGRVSVCMAEATFDYSWEYQGNAPKLVYTSLTDKCYLTLTQVGAVGIAVGLLPVMPWHSVPSSWFLHALALMLLCLRSSRPWRWATVATPTAQLALAKLRASRLWAR